MQALENTGGRNDVGEGVFYTDRGVGMSAETISKCMRNTGLKEV